jgi:hypothetical protein
MSTRPWVEFERLPARMKNKVTYDWRVLTRYGVLLGQVRWYSPWRRYSFFTFDACIFEQECLRDIAAFCERETNSRKAARKLAKLTAEQKADV